MSRGQLVLLTAAVFVMAGAVGQVLPLLAELEEAYDLTPLGVGAMGAAAFFASVTGQIVLAPLADRGHTRALLIGAVSASALGSLLFVLADGLPLLLTGRVITGLGLGAYLPASRAIVAAYDPARAGALLGRLQSVEVAGFLTGPILGAALVAAFGLDAPFVFAAVTTGLFIPIVATIPVPEVPVAEQTEPARRTVARLLHRRSALVAVLLSIGLIAPAGLYESVWDLFLEDLGAGNGLVALSLAFYGVAFIVMAPFGGRLADERGAVRMGLLALLAIPFLTAAYGWITVAGVAVALVLVEAVVNGTGMPAAQAAMAKATGPGELATGQGLAGASGELAAGFAALLAAPIYREFGARWLFTTAGLFIAAVTVAAWWLQRGGSGGAEVVGALEDDHHAVG